MSKSSKLKQIKSLVGKSGIYIGSKENGKKVNGKKEKELNGSFD